MPPADANGSPSGSPHVIVQPAAWPRPRGFANGVIARGRALYVAGQIGWNPDGTWPAGATEGTAAMALQFAGALDNVLAVMRAGGGAPEHVVRMTIYVTDLDAYRGAAAEIGAAYRARFGRHYPAMALVGVAGLVEPRARVEIEATAVLPDEDDATNTEETR